MNLYLFTDLRKSLRKNLRSILLKWRCPPRYIIEKKIFPKIRNRKILLIGVADYIKEYPMMLKQNDLYSIDIDPSVKKFGAEKHIIGNAVKLNNYFKENFFDVILHLGVLNYGINTLEETDECLKNCYDVLEKKGLLVISSQEGPKGSGRPPILIKNLKNFSLFTPVSAFGLPPEIFLNQEK
jgi:hypothetical protein